MYSTEADFNYIRVCKLNKILYNKKNKTEIKNDYNFLKEYKKLLNRYLL